MNKQKAFTAAGIALSFAIAIGGWGLTSMLIDRKSDALLSATGVTYIDVLPRLANADHGTEGSALQERQTLIGQDIYNVLLNWESTGSERAHEPTDTQLSMEQAIEAAKSSLDYFGEQGIIPVGIIDQGTEKINAYLCQNQTTGQASQFLDPIYSYWTVVLDGENTHATLVLNAMAGQVWKAEMAFSRPEVFLGDHDAIKALDAFVSYLGMARGDKVGIKIEGGETDASANIVGSMVQATVNIRIENTGNANTITEIALHLSPQLSDGGEIIVE